MLHLLEIGIGLVLVFTLVSLICSLLLEWLSAILSMRGHMLWTGLAEMLEGTRKKAEDSEYSLPELTSKLCGHPLMQSMVRTTRFDKIWPFKRSKPDYLPASTFRQVLMAVIAPNGAAKTLEGLRSQIANSGYERMRNVLLPLVDDAEGCLEQAKVNIEVYFDTVMNRVSGWYKRWTQLVLFFLAFGVALILGVDSLEIGRSLATDPLVRQAFVEAAIELEAEHAALPTSREPQTQNAERVENPPAVPEFPAESITELKERLEKIQETTNRVVLTPWWARGETEGAWTWFWTHLLGFLLTAVAASFGAPFWFDLLKRLIHLRAAGVTPAEERPKREEKKATSGG